MVTAGAEPLTSLQGRSQRDWVTSSRTMVTAGAEPLTKRRIAYGDSRSRVAYITAGLSSQRDLVTSSRTMGTAGAESSAPLQA